MIVWASPEERAAREQADAASMRPSTQDVRQVLADARSWGFAHGVRFPYRLFTAGTDRHECPESAVA